MHSRNLQELIQLLDGTYPQQAGTASRLVCLPADRPIVYVGDIHGDREAADAVLSRFPVPNHGLVFLGDIVDRGPHSLEALTAILRAKQNFPNDIHLLMGNHEARGVAEFSPANFWDALTPPDRKTVGNRLLRLPLAAWHRRFGILALHGALPIVGSLKEIDSIELGSDAWRAITWGDWATTERAADPSRRRPAFGPQAFRERSTALGVAVLVRSHQPSAPQYLFEDRCLTLFTSRAYGAARHVAVLRPHQEITTARDLELIPL